MDFDIISRVRDRGKKVFYGWWVVAAGVVINAFGSGSVFYGFNTFFNPMIEEFGWSRTVMSGAFSLSRLEGGIEGPITGWLIDKFGARKIMFIGMAIAGAGFIALRTVHSPLSLYLIFGLIISLGTNIGYNHATTAAVAKWFISKRSRAIAFLTAGNGIGGAIFVPTIAWLIVQFGWRWAATIIGLAMFVTVLPIGLIIRSTPEEMGLVPDGQPGGQRDSSSKTEGAATGVPKTSTPLDEVDFGVREAMKTGAFWIYTAAMTFRSCILSAIVIHQIPHLTDIGIPYQTASNVLGLMVLVSVPPRLFFGWLGDRFSKRILMFLLCLIQSAGIFIFIHASTTVLLYLFVVIYGLGYGGIIPLTHAIRADLFGRKNYAMISGMMVPVSMVGTVTAPIFAGYLYDVTQSYDIPFYTFAVLIALAGVLFLIIPRPSRSRVAGTSSTARGV